MSDLQAPEETALARGRRTPSAIRALPSGPGRPIDRSAFDALYRDEWPGLVALGWSLTGSWARAEELTQDAFADAYRRWDEVGGLDRPGAWVRRALINRTASDRRRKGVESRGLARWSSRSAIDDDAAGADRTGDQATDRVGDPEFWAAVRALPGRQAECVALHYLEDRSVADIALVLGCKESTVKVHLHRGRTALATRLGGSEPNDIEPAGTDPEEAR